MIGACPAGIAADALVTEVLATADCLIGTEVERGYGSLLAPGGSLATALTIALTIYVAVFGYRLLLGLSSLTLSELVPHFIKIGVIVALVTSWPSYQALVFETLFHGPQQLADVIVRQAAGPGAASGDVLAALQSVFERLTDAAGDAWAQAAAPAKATAAPVVPVVPGIPPAAAAPVAAQLPFQLGAPQFVAALLWVAALVLMAASVGVLLVVRIVLALLLLLGPMFVALALFRSTRGLSEGWLRVTIKFALVPLFALPLIAVAVAVLAPLAAGLDGTPVGTVRESPVLLILLVVLVFAAVMVQAARLGGGIAGGIRLSRGPGRAAGEPARVSVTPAFGPQALPVASRAEAIVKAINTGGDRRMALQVSTGLAVPAMIAATRTISGPTAASVAESSGRLGQGYRRLAIGTAATPRR